MLPRLGEHLDRNVVGNEAVLYKAAAELIFRIAGGGKADLDLFKPDLYERLEKLKLFVKAHRYYQSLISVAQVYGAPYGSAVNVVLFCPVHRDLWRIEVLPGIFFIAFHLSFLSFFGYKKTPLPKNNDFVWDKRDEEIILRGTTLFWLRRAHSVRFGKKRGSVTGAPGRA